MRTQIDAIPALTGTPEQIRLAARKLLHIKPVGRVFSVSLRLRPGRRAPGGSDHNMAPPFLGSPRADRWRCHRPLSS
jgi:hypothetical protein